LDKTNKKKATAAMLIDIDMTGHILTDQDDPQKVKLRCPSGCPRIKTKAQQARLGPRWVRVKAQRQKDLTRIMY
jgi:hypothetical protein